MDAGKGLGGGTEGLDMKKQHGSRLRSTESAKSGPEERAGKNNVGTL